MLAYFNQVFLEDTVYLKGRPDLLGLVIKTWHDFESGESDSEDEESTGPVSFSFLATAIVWDATVKHTDTDRKKKDWTLGA